MATRDQELVWSCGELPIAVHQYEELAREHLAYLFCFCKLTLTYISITLYKFCNAFIHCIVSKQFTLGDCCNIS